MTSPFPTPIVEVAFTAGAATSTYLTLGDSTRGLLGTGTLGPSSGPVWTDITTFVHSFSTRRGATDAPQPILRYEAGTSSTECNNSARRFDPTNLSGPYV